MLIMGNKKILIIEDDETFGEILNEYLLMKGFEVAVATDGLSGIELHKAFSPDLVLLDIILPKMNGIEVSKTIRSKDKITPILFMSGTENQEDDLINSLDSEKNDYLEKGFHLDLLLCKINDRLGDIPESTII